ncbi:MAG: sulfatase [Candidatus Aminicenantaceae bacterium]
MRGIIRFRSLLPIAAAAGLMFVLLSCGGSSPVERPNILFIIVDDLRPELGCYGNAEIQTPHIDRFAQESLVFTRAYCQAAACAPSRASVMLGMRPDTTRVWSLGEKFREIDPEAVTMPQHFSRFGYYTVSMGKIFHNHMPDRVSFDEADLRPAAYNTPELIDREPESFYHDEEINKEHALVRAERIKRNPNAYAGGWAYGRSTESFDAPDNAFYDGAQTELALETLERLKDKDQPFFLALGYYRPHLPFVAPEKYWDLYDRDKISPAGNPFLPQDSPIMAMNSMYELKACYDLEFVKHPSVYQLPEETGRLLKHGYYASVSFVDACIGKVMDGLKEMGLDKNTIVVLWGDHGWKLGEHGSWCKQTNYSIDTRVPLLIRAPGVGVKGKKSDRLTELVDLYPTLCDLAGIEIPETMEGTSLRPLLEQPEQELKSAAFSQYVRRPKNSPDGKRYMGYSMVTSRYHYVEWYQWSDETKTAGELAGIELYDLQIDPDENINIAGLPDSAETVQGLAEQLKAGWRAARNTK